MYMLEWKVTKTGTYDFLFVLRVRSDANFGRRVKGYGH